MFILYLWRLFITTSTTLDFTPGVIASCSIARSRYSLCKKPASALEDCGPECRRKPAGADLRPHSSELSQVPSLFLSRRAVCAEAIPQRLGDCFAEFILRYRRARNDKCNIVQLLTCSRWTLVQRPQRSLWPWPGACFTVFSIGHRHWSSGLGSALSIITLSTSADFLTALFCSAAALRGGRCRNWTEIPSSGQRRYRPGSLL